MLTMAWWWAFLAVTDVQAALAAHQAGRWEEAAASYRAHLRAKPADFQARSNLGAVLVQQGLYEEAIAEYRLAVKLAPTNPGIAYNLALAYYKSGDIPQAARELSTLRAINPDALPVTLLLADCWLQMEENAKVVELLKPLEAQRSNDLSLAYLLGTALVRDGKVDEGQIYLNRIFAKGDSAEVRLLLGTAKLNAADFAGAREDLARAAELNHSLPSVHSFYGQALMATGDTAGAVREFQAELRNYPNDFTANLNLGVLYKNDQEFAAARDHLSRALRIRPGDLRVRYQLGTIALAEGRLEDARQQLEAVTAEAPSFVEAHVSLAIVYYRLKRKEDGDRERQIVEKLNAEAQERQPKAERAP